MVKILINANQQISYMYCTWAILLTLTTLLDPDGIHLNAMGPEIHPAVGNQ